MTHAALGAIAVWVVALTYVVGGILRRKALDDLARRYMVEVAKNQKTLAESQQALLVELLQQKGELAEMKTAHDELARRAFVKGEVN